MRGSTPFAKHMLSSPDRRRLIVIWLLLGSLAAGVCSLIWPAAHLGEELLPVGNDSFYHARRILDAVQNPGAFYQFDEKIHAPEGSQLTWPWGYDYFTAVMVRAGLALGLTANPMAIIIWLPVAAVYISVGLMMLMARRLGLSSGLTALAASCVALSPLTQFLHGVGIIDHHFAEYIFILAALTSGLWWLSNEESPRAAIATGAILGVAPAIHNGLFVVQIPLVITLLAFWAQGMHLPRRTIVLFSTSLLLATVGILIPSQPFRTGQFEFYLLSWFHLYIAFGTAAVAWLTTQLQRNNRGTLMFFGAGIALLLPLVGQILFAQSFLVGDIVRLDRISEMRSLRELALGVGGLKLVTAVYSFLLWLAPFAFLICATRAWKERKTSRLYFWVAAICGFCMLATQFRLHYFGSFALYLPWLILAQEWIERRPDRRKAIHLLAALAFILTYGYSMRYQLVRPMNVANDPTFVNLHPLLDVLARNCEKDPGIVLADADAGHYIRYYTNCSVIANNFLLTKQHEDKIHLIDDLFDRKAANLPSAEPHIAYVLVRPLNIVRTSETSIRYMSFSDRAGNLTADLLMRDVATVPSVFRMLHEVRIGEEGIPYARLFKIDRSEGAMSPSRSSE